MFTSTKPINDYELLQQFKGFLTDHKAQIKDYPDLETYVANAHAGFYFTPLQTDKIPARYNRVIRQLTSSDYQQLAKMLQL
ncbi:hypothetical protein MK904_13500 [Loigolactobacillus coryniformis]|jgi:hypothetical protein|uniref:Uncharacterized protein n=4 Tax=Loigolactobacillus coryniformis TaxID=1610 RepID=A0A0R1EZI4_9LACO|nr:hypothetical protein [Loigolactobacillus coryniformis]OEH90159.1 hypothetical protein ATO00_05920 [Loigolactobacillus coryniformis subsp. coryniformis]RRG06482.1 MAG: hypothetical protein DUD28_02400 [Lactobacillus sp.]ATO43464.1 hypothetical protein LC20004_05890 [Loigolactobacillus coryniformis subsp. torquens DSM 20004 = KCTC 3535]ATO55146.1 hypothetical protein LC20001_05665 [Loigolactobacillus coryniformis subsp. coryniformis KCTC 3167 = DSM 20001]KRK15084.1 hypothetical protein FD22_G